MLGTDQRCGAEEQRADRVPIVDTLNQAPAAERSYRTLACNCKVTIMSSTIIITAVLASSRIA
ncbi:hypothetical protein EAH87_16275 [Sphingomonas koreensis]|nr:hypothetical protein EAH87_16275 [Sphingomonas koreensis]